MPVNLDSLLARLAAVPDPGRPQGRRYPLASLLGLVVLGTVHGETSLRGIWVWARYHWPHIWHTLGFPSAWFPALSTIWSVLAQLDRSALEQLTAAWTAQVFPQLEGWFRADGKVVRGRRRDDTVGVQLVALVQHQHAVVLQQRPVTDGNGELGALWHLLQETHLAQRVVTLDAGL